MHSIHKDRMLSPLTLVRRSWIELQIVLTTPHSSVSHQWHTLASKYWGFPYLEEFIYLLTVCFHIVSFPSSSGVAEIGVTVPDTITEWKAGALCLSQDTGLGISLPATMKAFQPFFVELTMPYSVVRGEAFTLKATVLNYLPKCIRVRISIS